MKTRYLWMLAVSMLLATTNSFAQNSENSNPYAIFGCTPYVAGDKDAGASAEKVFVIENFAKGSKVARIEHNPQTGRVRLLNKRGKLLKEKLLKACENGWLTQDRFAEKYYSISPYAYCAGNPVRYIDINGDSINMAWLQQVDVSLGTNYTGTVLSDLSSQTGLTYSVSQNGILTYAKDANGNAVIATDANGNQLGSSKARDIMTRAIDHTDMVTISGGRRTGVPTGTNSIGVNIGQMESQINGAVGIDNRTLGWGMTLMHEIQHTQVGGGLSDSPYGAGNPGPVATNMNIVRAELNAQDGNYGQRMSYPALLIGGAAYVPFNRVSQSLVNAQIAPYPSAPTAIIRTQYIRF